jgi:hypothetical protein
MGHLFLVTEKNDIPCHERVFSDHKKQDPLDNNCFEHCMGVYDDMWWLVPILLDDCDISWWKSEQRWIQTRQYDLKKYIFVIQDPPSITRIWYARIWKEIKKVE